MGYFLSRNPEASTPIANLIPLTAEIGSTLTENKNEINLALERKRLLLLSLPEDLRTAFTIKLLITEYVRFTTDSLEYSHEI